MNQDSLKNFSWEHKSDFEVFYKIKNISDKNQEITMWTGCTGASWTSNRPEIIPGQQFCMQNQPYTITIKPNKEITRALPVLFLTKTGPKPGPMAFRLGFYPRAGVVSVETQADKKDIIWSNDVTINVPKEQK